MPLYCESLGVLYNASRGCLFFWTFLVILSLVWIILMFIKKRIGDSPQEQVYKDKKEEPTTYQINNPSGVEKKENQYQKSDEGKSEDKQYDYTVSGAQLEGNAAPGKGAVDGAQPASAEPEPDGKSGLEKAMFGFEEFLFNYAPFFVINVLNIICLRSWAFNLVIWFLIMLPICIINLLGLFIKIENRFLQCFLKSIWVLVGVAWYINFYTIQSPCVNT